MLFLIPESTKNKKSLSYGANAGPDHDMTKVERFVDESFLPISIFGIIGYHSVVIAGWMAVSM